VKPAARSVPRPPLTRATGEYLAAADAEIVVTEALARTNALSDHAARRDVPTWTVDDALAAALLGAAAIRDPTRAAARSSLRGNAGERGGPLRSPQVRLTQEHPCLCWRVRPKLVFIRALS
jgi:hypothetical protein